MLGEWLTSCSTSSAVRFLPLVVFVPPPVLLLEVGVDARVVAAVGEDDDLLKFLLLYSNARNFAAATESFGDPFLEALGDTEFLLGGMMSYRMMDLLTINPHGKWNRIQYLACSYLPAVQ